MKILPIFTSAYSFRSILTLDKPKEDKSEDDKSGSDSIIDICKDNGLDNLFLVEDNMVGFLEAKKNSEGIKNFCFGLRLTFCSNIDNKTPESKKTESKYIIFARNSAGYFRLTKIFTKANMDGFLDYPRIDFKSLKELWSDEDLILVVPFYDSFIYNNNTKLYNCIPDFSFTNPIFFIEDNDLYIDKFIKEKIDEFNNKYELQNVKSIYYKDRKDFFAWQTYKCIKNESTLRKPNLDNCMSAEFCFESWKEKNNE